MREFARKYFDGLVDALQSVTVSNSDGQSIEIFEGIEMVAQNIISLGNEKNKLMFVGNGASAAIASHMATDYWKNGGIRSTAFNDISLLTCISNDYGYKHVFEKPIEMFADTGDMLMAISSSGKSENILRAVQAAKKAGCQVITFSGFQKDNPLRSMGDYNFYVASPFYGPVEILHLSICHCILDAIIKEQNEV